MYRTSPKPPLLRLTMPVSVSGGGFIMIGIALASHPRIPSSGSSPQMDPYRKVWICLLRPGLSC